MADFLLVRPAYDRGTRALHSWAADVRAAIDAAGSDTCRDLTGPDVTRDDTEMWL